MKIFKTLLALSSAATVGACGKPKTSEIGSTVVIDYQGFLNGVAFEGGTAKDYSLKLGSKKFIDTFEDQLVGFRAGDATEVTVTFPKDYPSKLLAGKKTTFEVKIKKVK